jgi:secondary thiamine-phosphate synthase enzyme
MTRTLTIRTRSRGFTDLTPDVAATTAAAGVREGLCTVFVRHTSASLLIQENADPDVRRDLETFFSRLVRDGDPMFVHDAEGPDDMAAHLRCALTAVCGSTAPRRKRGRSWCMWRGRSPESRVLSRDSEAGGGQTGPGSATSPIPRNAASTRSRARSWSATGPG